MSIALWAALDTAKERIAELERELAAVRAQNIEFAYKVEQIEQWIAARKPGPKPRDGNG